jgi:hypothetical protein
MSVWAFVALAGCTFRSVSFGLSDRWKCHQICATSVAVGLYQYSVANLQDKEQLLGWIGVILSVKGQNARPADRMRPATAFSAILFQLCKLCPGAVLKNSFLIGNVFLCRPSGC